MQKPVRELLTIATILGAIVLLALPRFTSSPRKIAAEQTALVLRQIALQEEAYKKENGRYVGVTGGEIANVLCEGESDLELLIGIPSNSPYVYAWAQVTDSTYRVTASGNIDADPQLDVWSVDQTGITSHLRID